MIRARNALLVVLVMLGVLWIIQVINNADAYRLSIDYGIEPHRLSPLPYIFSAPFLHWSWAHIEGNSIPFLVLGFLAAYRGIPKFLVITFVITVTSGLCAWLTSPASADTVGASGVIFGWLGYVVVRGFFDHNKVDIFVGLVVGINYISLFSLLFPAPHLSYEGHIGGLIGGVLCGWLLRAKAHTAPGQRLRASASPKRDTPSPADASAPVRRVEVELAELKQQIIGERHNVQRSTGES
jgi:membrane associated rhomboid family serine protease